MPKFAKHLFDKATQKITWAHWFAFFNIILAIGIGSRYAFITEWPHTLLGRIYFFTNIIGQFSFIIFAAFLAILFPLSFIIKNPRSFQAIAITLATAGLTLLILDTEVFSRFGLHLSSLVLNLLINPDNPELSRSWQLLFVPMPFILLIEMLFANWSWLKLRSLERQKWIKPVSTLFIAVFIATHLLYAWADAFLYRPITVQRGILPLSYPMTARNFFANSGLINKNEFNKQINSRGSLQAPYINYPLQPLTFDNSKLNEKNVIIINIEGLRHDVITPKLMPNLSRYAQNSLTYTEHYSSSNINHSSLMSLFYGLDGNYYDSILSQKTYSVLFTRLHQLNYKVALFTTNNADKPLFQHSLIHYDEKVENNLLNYQIATNWKNWFTKTSEKGLHSFSYLEFNLLNTLSQQPSNNTVQLVNYYNLQLTEIDKQLNVVLSNIEENNPDSVVIITSTKGYSFKENSNNNLNYFARSITQVPLIIHWPGKEAKQVNNLTSVVDIVPTLMQQLFATQSPAKQYSQGSDLLSMTAKPRQWILMANNRWQVVVTQTNEQYHIGHKGEFAEYNSQYQTINSSKPPLALFIQAIKANRQFIEH